MTKNLPFFVLPLVLLASACSHPDPNKEAQEGTMVNSEFHDYHADFRRDSLAAGYMRNGDAKDWQEAQDMASAAVCAEEAMENSQKWADEARARAEAERQAPIQEAIRDVDLSKDE